MSATSIASASPSIWSDLKTTLRAVFSTVVTIATTSEKVVQLAECEVDNLREMQGMRLDFTKQERIDQAKVLAEA